ncbi:prophage tail fiber N-terminal domain-containing protein [Serratia proteamaculans]|uniref:prophage tail fiber N-terminal domain-containing protein n=1 Tax=Serratia proteamaculans TaxID=28151 RepID=UPI0039BEC772
MSILVEGTLLSPAGHVIGSADIVLTSISTSLVVLGGTPLSIQTDPVGRYSFTLKNGNYAVSVSKDGNNWFSGMITVTDLTVPKSINALILQDAMMAEIPSDYWSYFQAQTGILFTSFGKIDEAVSTTTASKDIVVAARDETLGYKNEAKANAEIAQNIADANTYHVTESDPDGTVAGLAGTPVGKYFRVGPGAGEGFKYFLNDNGVALEVSSELGEKEFTSRFYTDDNFYGVSSIIYDDNDNAIGYTDDLGITHMFNISLKDGYDISHDVEDMKYVSHVNEDDSGNIFDWTCDLGIHHQASITIGVASDTPKLPISPQVYEHNEISEIGWNQWINNQAVKVGSDYLLSSVRLGSMKPQRILGNFAISRRQGERGRFGTYEFGPSLYAGGSASTDDHDAPSILLDTRPNAERPLQIFNANHGTNASLLRYWSSPTFDPANIGAATQLSGHGGMTYAQSYRNPNNQDEIAVFSRYGNSNTARWFIYLSADNGSTWKANSFIGGDDLYMTSCQSLDAGSIHIAIQNHPRATDTRVLYLRLSWADKSLKNNAGDVFAANIMNYQYTNPFVSSIPDIVFTAASGNTKRLFEIKDVASSILFLIAEFQPTDFSYRMMKLVKFESGVLTAFDVGDCGRAIENSSYVAGGCIVSETDILVCYWQNTPALGKLSRFKYDGASWGETIMDSRTDGNKICRPLIFKEFYQSGGVLKSDDTNTIAYQRGNYVGYNLFDMDAVITKI